MPNLSEKQVAAFRKFTRRHIDDNEGRLSVNPIVLARVLAGDKPGGYINLNGETYPDFGDTDAYIAELCSTLELETRKIKEARGCCISRSDLWLDMLPTVQSSTDAFHRRCGVVYGYPQEAIEDFIETTTEVATCDLVRAGIFNAEEIAYLVFVSFSHNNSLEQYEKQIERGKEIRHRMEELAEAWKLPVLDEYVSLLHSDVVDAYRGNASWGVPTMFHPEETVSKDDVISLLS